MKILVVGGAGFIGSHLVERLVKERNEVSVIDNLSSGRTSNLTNVIEKIYFYPETILNYGALKYLTRKTDIVYHLATQCLVKGLEDPWAMHEVNDIGTFNILKAAKENGNKVVFISTSEVYGLQTDFPMKETVTLNPVSIYGQTKAVAEEYVRFFNKVYEVEAVIIRPFNTFGPRQREDGYAGVITSFMKKIKSEEPPIIHGDGQQTRDFSYVSDIVDGILLLSRLSSGETVNLGSGKETSILKLAELIEETMNKDWTTGCILEEPRFNDLRRLQADTSIAKKLGYEPKVTLEEGLKKYIEWWRQRN